jgi:hypothetical protein
MSKKAVEEANIGEVVEGQVKEEVIERPYTLRKLNDGDLFSLLQLLRKLGIKDFKDAIMKSLEKKPNFNPNDYESKEEKKAALDKIQRDAGIDIFIDLSDFMISKIETNKDDIYEFYSGLSGIPSDEIKNMEFGTLPLMIYDSFSEVKNTAFFKVLSKLL